MLLIPVAVSTFRIIPMSVPNARKVKEPPIIHKLLKIHVLKGKGI